MGSAAVAAGLVTPDQLRGPRFTRLLQGIFVRADAEVDFVVRCRAAALLGDGRGVLAGWAAAELLGAACAPSDAPVELLLPGGGRSRPGLVIGDEAVPPAEVTWAGATRVTTPARTGFDLGRRIPLVHAIMGVDALRYACELDPDAVRAVARRRLGARGIRQLPEVLRRSTHLAQSPMESRVRVAIENAGLPLPILQYRVGRYILDMAYPDQMLAVEYDGRDHLTPKRARHDLNRQAYLTGEGWTVLRFPPSVVLYETWKIATDVRWRLRRR